MPKQLKKGIDHIGVCVVYFCHDAMGNVVMAKRTDKNRDEAGRWDIGGGAVEHGDTLEDALRREIGEEYGTEILTCELLGFREVFRNLDKTPTHWIAFDYKVRVNPQKVHNAEPDKHEAVEWFTLLNMPSPVHSQFPNFLRLYADKLGIAIA